jgi:hypothetical protein
MADTIPYGSTPVLLDKDPVFSTIAERPSADYYGGRPWKCQVGSVLFTSDGTSWQPVYTQVAPTSTGNVDTQIAVAATSITPFKINSTTVLNRVGGIVGTTQATKLMDIGLYDSNKNLLASTGLREVPDVGQFEFYHPEVTLLPGNYYYALSCNGTTATFGHTYKYGGFTKTLSLPVAVTLTNLVPANTCPALVAIPKDTLQPTGFQDLSQTKYRVYGANGSQPWGLNTSNFKICMSTDSGATFTDMMAQPSYGGASIYDMVFDATKLYVFTSDMRIFQSSDLTAGATWTEITCPVSAGLRRSVAVARPYGITVWNDYVVMGEYSGATDLQNDPSDPAGPRLLKYGPLSGTPAWSLAKQFTAARHVHSLFQDGVSKLWVSLGDAGYGADIGLWRMTDIVANTITKWTTISAPYTDYYGVDVIEINPGVGCAAGIYCTSDRPGHHLLFSKAAGNAGGFNLSTQLPRLNTDTAETVRSLAYDKNGTKNLYYFTAESSDIALYVTPPPYTQAYRLTGVSSALQSRAVISGNYLMMFNRRYLLPTFQ